MLVNNRQKKLLDILQSKAVIIKVRTVHSVDPLIVEYCRTLTTNYISYTGHKHMMYLLQFSLRYVPDHLTQ